MSPGRHTRFGGLFWQRDFRLLWTGETISKRGSWELGVQAVVAAAPGAGVEP